MQNRIITKETIREYDQYGKIIKETIKETYDNDPCANPNVPYFPSYPSYPLNPTVTPIPLSAPIITCLLQ